MTAVQFGAVRLELGVPSDSGTVAISRDGQTAGAAYRVTKTAYAAVVYRPHTTATGGSVIEALERLAQRIHAKETNPKLGRSDEEAGDG